MRGNSKKGKGVSAGAIVVIGAVFTIVVAIIWGVVTETKRYQVQQERTPSIKAKAGFDHLKYFSNYSFFLSGHWGTERFGEMDKVWWDKGENKIPSEEEFGRRLGKEIKNSFKDYAGQTQMSLEDLRTNVSNSVEGFKVNSSLTLKVSSSEGKVKVFNKVNYTRTIGLRIFLLRTKGAELVDYVDILKQELLDKLKSDTKQHENKNKIRCLPSGEGCSGDDYPGPSPNTASELTSMLNSELGDRADLLDSGDFDWALSVKELNAEIKTYKENKWTEGTGKSCKCKVKVAVEEEWTDNLRCAGCEERGDYCYDFVSCEDRNVQGNCVNCTVELSKKRTWTNTGDCEDCKGGTGCIEFIKSLKNKKKCWAEYWHSYNVTPVVEAVVEDQNNNYKIFGPSGYQENLKLKFLLKIEELSTEE